MYCASLKKAETIWVIVKKGQRDKEFDHLDK